VTHLNTIGNISQIVLYNMYIGYKSIDIFEGEW